MGITVSGGKLVQALDYNKVYMDSMIIVQKQVEDNSLASVFKLTVNYRLYAVDELDKRHYEGRTRRVFLENYLAVAIGKAKEGSSTLIDAMKGIESALTQLIQDSGEVGQVSNT